MKQIFILFAVIYPGIHATAQTVEGLTVGVHGTYNISNATLHGVNIDADFLRPEAMPGFAAGIHVNVPLGGSFHFNPELNYTRRGFRYGELVNVNLFEVPIPLGAEVRTNLDHIEIPLTLKYTIGSPGQVRAYVKAGPTLSYGASGSANIMINSVIDFKVTSIPIDYSSNLANRFGVGGLVGAGVAIPAGPGALSLDVNYRHGFTESISAPLIDVGLRNRSLGFGIGYSIPIQGKNKPGSV